MTITRPLYLNPAFDDFLYASIGKDLSGLPVSVLTALARQDLDPWEEAVRLDGLQQEAAMSQLLSMIATVPAGTKMMLDPHKTAERLLGLLPHIHRPHGRTAQTNSRDSGLVVGLIVLYVVTVILMLLWGR